MSAAEKIVTADKYATLDIQLLAAIGAGKNRHAAICADPIITEEATSFVHGNTSISRVVEARMKALRKKGLIKYDSTMGWKVLNV